MSTQRTNLVPLKKEHIPDHLLFQQAMYYQHPAMFFVPNFVYQPKPIQYVPIRPKVAENTNKFIPMSPPSVRKDKKPQPVAIPTSEFTATKMLSPIRNQSAFPPSPQSPDFLKGLSPMLLAKKRDFDFDFEIENIDEEYNPEKRIKLDVD